MSESDRPAEHPPADLTIPLVPVPAPLPSTMETTPRHEVLAHARPVRAVGELAHEARDVEADGLGVREEASSASYSFRETP